MESTPSQDDMMTQLTSSLGIQLPLIARYRNVFMELAGIWASLMDDVSVFVVALGVGVMIAGVM
ncbi:hypothetical protein HK101_004313 [Irineochytrium annulatum]|nr:hypothetical protein HK101_004313 [Irineochytrium annulatum]